VHDEIEKHDVEEIQFLNGNRAQVVYVEDDTIAEDIISSLEIEIPKSVIFVAGGAANLDEENEPRLIQLFSRSIAKIAFENKSLIVDGGTDSGVMSLAGLAVADRGRKTNLLGVAPASMVHYPGKPEQETEKETYSLEPNHSHFVLVKKDNFGGEKDMLFKLLKYFSINTQVVMILVNGGTLSKFEVLNSVRTKISIIVMEQSGRLADEIAELYKKKPKFIEDPVMAEIIDDGNIHLIKTDTDIPRFKRLLQRLLSGNSMLRQAWEQFAIFDLNANHQKKVFTRIQNMILTLAVLATTLAVFQEKISEWPLEWPFRYLIMENSENIDGFLRFWIILIPITVSVFIAASNRFKYGKKWIFLRSAAEEIKQEIFKYRIRAGIYSDKNTKKIWRDVKLAKKLASIRRKVMHTDVNLSGLKYQSRETQPQSFSNQAKNDGLSLITPDQYIKFRLEEQLKFYKDKTIELEKSLRKNQWAIYIFGGVGTLLAAVGLEIWIAVTTALAGTFTTYMQFKQIEKTLMEYNQSAADLSNIRDWWIALTPLEQSNGAAVDKLVEMTEYTFKNENVGWVQQMQDMIEELQEEQSKENIKENTE